AEAVGQHLENALGVDVDLAAAFGPQDGEEQRLAPQAAGVGDAELGCHGGELLAAFLLEIGEVHEAGASEGHDGARRCLVAPPVWVGAPPRRRRVTERGGRAMADARVRARARVTGGVQGVFYRASTRDRARELGLIGWVKNTADGAVELEVEGEAEQVE